MADFIRLFKNNSLVTAGGVTGLVSQVNTFLATLLNPSIRFFDLKVQRPANRLGVEYLFSLNYSDGGAALATPFLIRIDQSANPTTLQTTIQAAIDAQPAYFWSGARMAFVDQDDTKLGQVIAATMYNTTGGASANFLPR